MLAWVISHQGVMAIPKAATIAHVQQNAAVLEVELSSAELAMLDKAYPAPKGKNCAGYGLMLIRAGCIAPGTQY